MQRLHDTLFRISGTLIIAYVVLGVQGCSSTKIEGRVLDAQTMIPVEAANVFGVTSLDSDSAITDAKGFFVLKTQVCDGSFLVQHSKYKTGQFYISNPDGKMKNIVLKEPIKLVKADK